MSARDRLPPTIRDEYDRIAALPAAKGRDDALATLCELAEEYRAAMEPELQVQYDQVLAMAPSAIRDDMLTRLFRISIRDFDYFDWNGVCVRVACAGGAVQTLANGLWLDGGPSYARRQEECEPLTPAQVRERFPGAIRPQPLT